MFWNSIQLRSLHIMFLPEFVPLQASVRREMYRDAKGCDASGNVTQYCK